MDTTISDVDSVASVVMVPKTMTSPPPAVDVLSSSSDLDVSLESLGSPKKKKKKKHKHSSTEEDVGDGKIEVASDDDANRYDIYTHIFMTLL